MGLYFHHSSFSMPFIGSLKGTHMYFPIVYVHAVSDCPVSPSKQTNGTNREWNNCFQVSIVYIMCFSAAMEGYTAPSQTSPLRFEKSSSELLLFRCDLWIVIKIKCKALCSALSTLTASTWISVVHVPVCTFGVGHRICQTWTHSAPFGQWISSTCHREGQYKQKQWAEKAAGDRTSSSSPRRTPLPRCAVQWKSLYASPLSLTVWAQAAAGLLVVMATSG